MIHEDPGRLLDRAGVLRHPCDLDLLLFFARHPHVLLASESLASFLGYDIKVIARSLDRLLAAGLLTRRQTAAHAARLYVFTTGGDKAEWVSSLVRVGSTRTGRRGLMAILNGAGGDKANETRTDGGNAGVAGKPGQRRVESPPAARRSRPDARAEGGSLESSGNDDG